MESCRKQAVIPCQDGHGARTQPCWVEVNAGAAGRLPSPVLQDLRYPGQPRTPRSHFPCPLLQSPRAEGCSCSSTPPLLPVSTYQLSPSTLQDCRRGHGQGEPEPPHLPMEAGSEACAGSTELLRGSTHTATSRRGSRPALLPQHCLSHPLALCRAAAPSSCHSLPCPHSCYKGTIQSPTGPGRGNTAAASPEVMEEHGASQETLLSWGPWLRFVQPLCHGAAHALPCGMAGGECGAGKA